MISGNSAVPTVKMAGEVKKPLSGLKKKQPETVKEFLDNPASYPYEMRLGAYLAWKEGEGEKEWLTLEREFERKMLGERGECCHSDLKDELDLNYDVGSMEDEEVMAEIRGWESGPHLRCDPETGKDEWYIGLLAMSPQQPLPTGSYQRKAAKEKKQPGGTESKPQAEVSS